MKEGDRVLVMGVHRSARVRCDDPACTRDHSPRTEQHIEPDGTVIEELFRVHYEDGPREGIPGTLGGVVRYEKVLVEGTEDEYREVPITAYQEKGGRYIVTLDSGGQVSADKSDVKAVV